MKKLFLAALAAVCLSGLAATAQTTTISATSLQGGGAPLSLGTVSFQPRNSLGVGQAIGLSGGGLLSPDPIVCHVTAGAIDGLVLPNGTVSGSCSVPDEASSSPSFCYDVTVRNTSTGLSTSGHGYTLQCVQGISGRSWPLDDFAPSNVAGTIVSTQPVTFRGAYSTSTSYAVGDMVSYSGATYISLISANINNQPSTAHSAWYAAGAPGPTGPTGPPVSFKGAWSSATTYALGDAVSYSNGASYASLAAGNLNNSPATDGTHWTLLAAAGQVTNAVLNSAVTGLSQGASTPGANLFDATKVTANVYQQEPCSTVGGISGNYVSGNMNVAGLPNIYSNSPIENVVGPAITFYDATGTCIGSSYGSTNGASHSYGYLFPPGTAIPVPSGAVTARATIPESGGDGTYPFVAPSAVMVMAAPVPSTYQAFGYDLAGTASTLTTTLSASVTNATNLAQPWRSGGPGFSAGRICEITDSIDYLQNWSSQMCTLLGGCGGTSGALAFKDSRIGRDYSTSASSGWLTNNSDNYGAVTQSTVLGCDVMLVELGTNSNAAAGLGSPADSPNGATTATLSAQINNMLQTLLTWNPRLQVVGITPYGSGNYNAPAGTNGIVGYASTYNVTASDGTTVQSTVPRPQSVATMAGIAGAIKATYAAAGVPVIDWFTLAGSNAWQADNSMFQSNDYGITLTGVFPVTTGGTCTASTTTVTVTPAHYFDQSNTDTGSGLGTGAAFTAVVAGGTVTTVTMTAAGSGYKAPPVLSFANCTGTVANVIYTGDTTHPSQKLALRLSGITARALTNLAR